MSFFIKNVRLLDPVTQTDRVTSVRLEGEHIKEIGGGAAPQDQVLDGTDKWLVPGLVDLSVNAWEPGFEYRDNIGSVAETAAMSGVTELVLNPVTDPVPDRADLIAALKRRGDGEGRCTMHPAASLTDQHEGKRLAPTAEVTRAGAPWLSDYGHPTRDAGIVRRAMEYARDFDCIVALDVDEPQLTHGTQVNEGRVSTRLGLRGAPAQAEEIAVQRALCLAKMTGAQIHLCRVSTAGAVELIKNAKAQGVKVTAAVAAHHLWFTEAALEGFETKFKVWPPLRQESDRQALISGLADQTLDAIVSDHTGLGQTEKDVPIVDAHFGSVSLPALVPTVLSLCNGAGFEPLAALRALTQGPARALGRAGEGILAGSVADLCLVDPNAQTKADASSWPSRGKVSAFNGVDFVGTAAATWRHGTMVYHNS